MFFAQDLVNFWFIKTDDDGAVNIYNGNAALAGFSHGFLACFGLLFDVKVSISHAQLIEILLSGVAKGAPGS